MDKPAPIKPEEFSAQADLVHKARTRLGRARVAFQKAQEELNQADKAWMDAWSTFNRYTQEAAGLQYESRPDADKQRYPSPAERWAERKSVKP